MKTLLRIMVSALAGYIIAEILLALGVSRAEIAIGGMVLVCLCWAGWAYIFVKSRGDGTA